MEKKIILMAIAVILIVGGSIASTMSRRSITSDSPMSPSVSNQESSTNTMANTVDIKAYQYSPQTTSVKVDTTVT